MLKQMMKLWACVAALGLAAPAQALVFPLGLQITQADVSNPLNAVVGFFASSGTANSGGNVITGSGEEFLSFSTTGDPTADLTLTIGTIAFTDEDEIEPGGGDVPEGFFQDGVFQGLDYVVLFTIAGGQAIGIVFDTTDLGQNTSAYEDGNHYYADFFDDGHFTVGVVTGFEVMMEGEGEDMETFLGALTNPFVEGNVVPEPSLALLAGAGFLGFAAMRRR